MNEPRWRYVDAHSAEIVALSSLAFLAFKAAKTMFICHSDEAFIWLSDPPDQKSLTHRWHSFPGCGHKCVTFIFDYKNGQFNHFGRMGQCCTLLAENVRPKIVDAPVMLILVTYSQSLDDQQLYGIMHRVVVGSQWIISIYKHLHPKASKPLNFWSTTRQVIWARNEVGLSC